jgi:hypothetical protein
MAYTLTENLGSRKVKQARGGITAIRTFFVYSDTPADKDLQLDPEAVLNSGSLATLGSAHPTIAGVTLKSVAVDPDTEVSNRGSVTYTYGQRDSGGSGSEGGRQSTPDANGEIWTFNMLSQTTTINAVLSDKDVPRQVTYDSANTDGARINTAINFDDEGVYGWEVYRPSNSVNVTKVYGSISEVNQSYRNTLRSLQNTVNDSTWPNRSEFGPQELLFIGADITYNLEEDTATVDYSFLSGITQKLLEFTIWGDTATEKKTVKVAKLYPFQALWMPLEKRIVSGEGADAVFSSYHSSVNVADVYQPADFYQLKIDGD